jgi:hypothetical protein
VLTLSHRTFLLPLNASYTFVILLQMLSMNFPYTDSYVPRAKFDVHSPLLRSLQRIRRSTKPSVSFHTEPTFTACSQSHAKPPSWRNTPIRRPGDCSFNIFPAIHMTRRYFLHMHAMMTRVPLHMVIYLICKYEYLGTIAIQ